MKDFDSIFPGLFIAGCITALALLILVGDLMG